MKLENYEPLTANISPAYWYEEGQPHEKYWVDDQNLYYHKFVKEKTKDPDPRKYWLITPWKPKGKVIRTKEDLGCLKWCVELCWHQELQYKNTPDYFDYSGWEWDFKTHKPI